LLRAMKQDPTELRGVGIQITKLDSEKGAEREAGQGTLSFGNLKVKEKVVGEGDIGPEDLPLLDTGKDVDVGKDERPRSRSRSSTPLQLEPVDPDPSVIPLSHSPPQTRRHTALKEVQAGPSVPPPSSDGIDPDFLAALPPELRQEVKQDYARTRNRAASEAVVLPAPVKGRSIDRAITISPAKPKTTLSVAHITRQLRPKVKTQLRAGAIAELPLYGAWAKAKDRETSIDLSNDDDERVIGIYRSSEIKELGIDVEVFAELPVEMQKEVVEEERRKSRQRKMLHRPADTSRVRARERQKGIGNRTVSLSPTRSSRAGSGPPALPRLTITRPVKPILLKASSLSDVLDTVTRWIESRGDAAPALKDATKVKAYLMKCVDESAGLGGVEMAVEVMKWMRTVLSERWDDEGVELRDEGREWWRVWRDFKEGLDGVCRARFGADLRI
jgi:DNA repair protein REV1